MAHGMLTKPSMEPSETHVSDAAIVHAVTSEFPKTRYDMDPWRSNVLTVLYSLLCFTCC